MKLAVLVLFALLTAGCMTMTTVPEWELSVTDGETRIVTFSDVHQTSVITLDGRRYSGIPISELFDLSGDDPFEITVTNAQGMSVSLSSETFDSFRTLIAWDASAELMLIGEEIPADLRAAGIRKIEITRQAEEMQEEQVLMIILGTQEHEITFEQLSASPFTIEGVGAFRTSAGTYYQSRYTGIPLAAAAGLFMDIEELDTAAAQAVDGFQMKYSADEITDEEEGIWVLAWKEDGEFFDESIGPFRTVKIGDPVPVIEGRRSARQVDRLILFRK